MKVDRDQSIQIRTMEIPLIPPHACQHWAHQCHLQENLLSHVCAKSSIPSDAELTMPLFVYCHL